MVGQADVATASGAKVFLFKDLFEASSKPRLESGDSSWGPDPVPSSQVSRSDGQQPGHEQQPSGVSMLEQRIGEIVMTGGCLPLDWDLLNSYLWLGVTRVVRCLCEAMERAAARDK